MRDISSKTRTLRTAVAKAEVKLSPSTVSMVKSGTIPKGDPLETAKVAAILAAKNTSQIIPYCHPLPIDFVGVEYSIGNDSITVTVTVKAMYKTGVEMEALTAASVAALTLYDMMKMVDKGMEIRTVRLLEKKGGKSDKAASANLHLRTAVLVLSDSISGGIGTDTSGAYIAEKLRTDGHDVVDYKIIPDDPEQIRKVILHYCDSLQIDLVLTAGGTGIGPRDNTPETVKELLEKEIPGIMEAARAYGQERTPLAMLSRGIAGIRKQTFIVTLPGSLNGVRESLEALLPGLYHSFSILHGQRHQ